jgi:hypothetical protein
MSTLFKWTLIGMPAAVVLCLAGCSLTRAGYKSPSYTVKERLGPVEVREYPELLLAQTHTRREMEGKDGSFMRLFRFITKGNASAQPIPMTTPVLYRGEGSSEAMAFVLPATMKPGEAPVPLDPAVQIASRPAGTYAVLRMKGRRRSGGREKAVSEIESALAQSGWRLDGPPEFAFYDPPWIPWFMEKNEVLRRVLRREPTR